MQGSLPTPILPVCVVVPSYYIGNADFASELRFSVVVQTSGWFSKTFYAKLMINFAMSGFARASKTCCRFSISFLCKFLLWCSAKCLLLTSMPHSQVIFCFRCSCISVALSTRYCLLYSIRFCLLASALESIICNAIRGKSLSMLAPTLSPR